MSNIFTGDQDDNTLYGTWENDILRGLGGNDFLMGGGGDDILEGGAGNDRLENMGGNNTYLFGRGDGQDEIIAYDYVLTKHNTIRFGEDIAPADILAERVNDNLVLRIEGTTDSITVIGYFYSNGPGYHPYAIEEVRFFDGASWDRAAILDKVSPPVVLDDGDNFFGGGSVDGKGGNDELMGSWNDDVLRGGDGNDQLFGFGGDDYLIGGAGDDVLDGGMGANTFRFAQGWGHDTIVLTGMQTPDATIIDIADTLPGTLQMSRSDNGAGYDLVISAKGASDTITVAGYFEQNNWSAAHSVSIVFADRSVWTYDQIEQATWPMPPGENLTGTEAGDWINGNWGDDRIDGGAGDDHLDGAWGNDALLGGEGNDRLFGGDGNDLLEGGAGDDYLEGGYGNDVLLGGDGFDELHGGDGDDILDGGAGDGLLDGGMGNNLILIGRDAGQLFLVATPDGPNTIVFDADVRPEDIVIKADGNWQLSIAIKETQARVLTPLLIGFPDGSGGSSTQTFMQLKFADGTIWDNDMLLRLMYTGDGESNWIEGSWTSDSMDGKGGDDTLFGHDGNDTLRGGSGHDMLAGGDGNDILQGGAGNDLLDAGSGVNTFRYALNDGADMIFPHWDRFDTHNTLEFGAGIAASDVVVRIDPNSGELTLTLAGGLDRVVVIQFRVPGQPDALETVRFADGTSWDSAEISRRSGLGDDDANWLRGGEGDDILDGQGGDDTLIGERGNDVLLGGAGSDVLYGEAGNDVLRGGDGFDQLFGGEGDDIFDAGAGDAMLDVGTGNNTILFGRSAGEVRLAPTHEGINTIVLDADVRPEDLAALNLNSNEITITIKETQARLVLPLMPDWESGNYELTQTRVLLQFADGTVWNNDSLLNLKYTGDDGANHIEGSWSNDTMDGRGGNDHLNGREGNDTISGGSGDDFLIGGMGNDVLRGQDGDDFLLDYEGDDILNGGAGNDGLQAGSGNNVFQVDLHGGIDRIYTAYEPYGAYNTLQFGEGIAPEDVMARIDPYSGDLRLTIKGGPDEVSVIGYRSNYGQTEGLQEVRFANGVSWNNAEITRQSTMGNEGDNWIEGTEAGETLDGLGGRDFLLGHGGDDLLLGGADSDVLVGGEGNNTLVGGAHDDLLEGGAGSDTYIFNVGDGRDQINDPSWLASPGSANVIRFGAGINASDLQFEDWGDWVRIIYGASDEIIISAFNTSGPAEALPVNRFEFADGSVWTYRELTLRSHAPVLASPLADQFVSEGKELAFTIPASTFADLDAGDVLKYQLSTMDGGDLPAWLKFDAQTGLVSGTPGYADGGFVQLKVTATDRSGQTASDDFRVGVNEVDPGPVLRQQIATQDATEASQFSLVIPAGTFVDPDGGAIWYQLARTGDAALPAWLHFDSASMTLSGTPGNADTGILQLRLTAIDSSGQLAYTEYSLNVANINQAPVLVQAIGGQSATEASLFSIILPADAFADPDGDVLSYSLALADGPLPAWLTFDSASMTLSGTPGDADTGNLQLRLTATDGGGKAVSANFALNVANINQAPLLVQAPASQSVEDGVAFSYVLPENMFTDADAGDSGVLAIGGLPAGFSFDAQTRTISGTASLAAVGQHALTVSFTDAGALAASAGFTLTVTAAASVTLTGTAGVDVLTGKSNSDVLLGLGGDDVLDGGIGADRLEGGNGNDTFYVDNAADVVVENSAAGVDTVMAAIDYTLGVNVERLTLNGDSAINATGNTLNNTITGNSGANLINGGLGDDSMAGGAGNDTYMVGSTSDIVTEALDAGFDYVISSVGRTLGANQEALTLTGTAAINGTGNLLNNLLQGNGAINTLSGGDGHDILQGGGGDDYLSDTSVQGNLFDGGLGADRLIGGAGNDLFIGGAGNDTITTSTGADIIAFNRGDGIDTVAVTSGSDNTVSLGNGILFSDLALLKSGSDLILKTGLGEQISFKGWYSSATANSVGTLQVVTEGGADHVAGSASAIHDNKIEQFDFTALVVKFDQVRVGQGGSFNWSLGSSLEQFSSGGSDTAAIGADLAYKYAVTDTLAALSAMPALAIVGSPSFGTGSQDLQVGAALNDGIAVLY